MKDLWQRLKETDKPIALYGTGDGADKIIRKMRSDGTFTKVKGIFASDGFVRRRSFCGFDVETYTSCKARLGDMIVLMCFGTSRPEVLEFISRVRSENEFYAPDVPVVGGNIFETAFYENNKDDIDAVRAVLSDELSRRTFDDTIKNKLTGDVSYLEDCEVSQSEADSLLSFGSPTTMVDLGADTGDTVLRYTELFDKIDKIFAVEPDPRNFRKLLENTAGLDITCINALIGDKPGTSTIATGRSRGRGVRDLSDKGGIDIAVTTVDDILKGSPAGFIKMDVEGAELAAIEGARGTIAAFRPQMQIACYHRSEDIWTIPLKVLSIQKEYRVYMRHMPHIPGWDTLFYFI